MAVSIGNTTASSHAQLATGVFNGPVTFAGHRETSLETTLKLCRNAIYSTDPSIDRDKLIDAKGERTPGTCEWIVKHSAYKSWFRGDTNLLWIRGGPGKGKTMISIFLTQQLSRSSCGSLVYYFCSGERNDATTVLRGLIWQLTEMHHELTSHVMPFMDPPDRAKATVSSSETLWTLFTELVHRIDTGRVRVLIDGLDECNNRSGRWLASKLAALGRGVADARMGVIVLSRHLSPLQNSNVIRLDPDHDTFVSADVETYIRARVHELSQQLDFHEEHHERIVQTLLRKSGGTFLWVGFVMEELFEKDTISEVLMALEELPAGLPAFYARMLQGIKLNHRGDSARLLTWVGIAFRRPTLETLVDVLRCRTLEGVDQRQATVDCVNHCAPLLVAHKEGVEFVHQSVKDYLLHGATDGDPALEMFRIQTPSAHLYAAQRCLQALSENTYLQYYALLNWPKHALSLAGLLLKLVEEEKSFFEENSAARDSWWRKFSHNFRGLPNEPPPRLHIACFLGLEVLVRFIFRDLQTSGVDLTERLTEKCCGGWTPLDYATENGDQSIVKLLIGTGSPNEWWGRLHDLFRRRGDLVGYIDGAQFLLDHGAEINTRDRSGQSPIQYAIATKDRAFVALLLARGASVSPALFERSNPLSEAANTGEKAFVQLMPSYGADANDRGVNGVTPLVHAIASADASIVELLLHSRADPNTPKDRPPLLQALRTSPSRKIVQLLLDHGADANTSDELGMTPLVYVTSAMPYKSKLVQLLLEHGAAPDKSSEKNLLRKAISKRDEYLLRWLLTHGVDPDTADGNETPPLLQAARSQNEAATRLLLAAGANPNTSDVSGSAALAYLIGLRCRQHHIMRLLIDHGATIDGLQDMQELRYAVEDRNLHLVRLLLARGVDPNAHRAHGCHVLIEAYRRIDPVLPETFPVCVDSACTYRKEARGTRSQDIFKLLLDHGANVDCTNDDGDTLLHLAVGANWGQKCVKLLVERNVDVNARDSNGNTALHIAFLNLADPSAMVQYLIDHGANTTFRNSDGDTPLHCARGGSQSVAIQHLIEAGADPDVKNELGETALHVAADDGNLFVAKALISGGADMNILSSEEYTLLHIAAMNGHDAMAQWLCSHGIDLNAQDRSGRTALHLATLERHSDMISLLIERGADMNAQDHAGKTALGNAVAQGDRERVRILLQLHFGGKLL